MGDIAIDCPVIDEGVHYDEGTGKVTFTKFRPSVFASQATFSEEGLRHLLGWMEGKESPIPAIEPVLVYKWVVTYLDGDVICQFTTDENDSNTEHETNSREIQWDRGVSQISIIPRHSDELPTFTFVTASGSFYRNGELLDVDYDGDYPHEAQIAYARKVTHTFGAFMGAALARTLNTAHTTVLQLLGWHVDGVPGLEQGNDNACCVIAIDDRGNWRAWKQAV